MFLTLLSLYNVFVSSNKNCLKTYFVLLCFGLLDPKSLICPQYYLALQAAANLNHFPVIVFDKHPLGKGVLDLYSQSDQI